MNIIVRKLTDVSLLREMAEMTTGKPCKMELETAYKNLHSLVRTQIFVIKFYDIPTSVMGHLVRHVHAQPYVLSHRPDRNPTARDLGRKTPTNMALLLNAEEIINISRARLCVKAAPETRELWQRTLELIEEVDPDLVKFCKRPCVQSAVCRESKPCGFMATEKYRAQRKVYKALFTPKH